MLIIANRFGKAWHFVLFPRGAAVCYAVFLYRALSPQVSAGALSLLVTALLPSCHRPGTRRRAFIARLALPGQKSLRLLRVVRTGVADWG